ncbi:MAG: FxLYD domain-containing protein [Candidatus Binataceae bacterium]
MIAKRGRVGLGALAILVAAAGFAVLIFSMLLRAEPIAVTQSLIRHEGDKVFVEGKLKNTGADSRPVDLEVRYFDSRGRQIGEDRVAVAGLRHNGQADFRSPPRELPEARDFTIYIDRGRNPYGD